MKQNKRNNGRNAVHKYLFIFAGRWHFCIWCVCARALVCFSSFLLFVDAENAVTKWKHKQPVYGDSVFVVFTHRLIVDSLFISPAYEHAVCVCARVCVDI